MGKLREPERARGRERASAGGGCEPRLSEVARAGPRGVLEEASGESELHSKSSGSHSGSLRGLAEIRGCVKPTPGALEGHGANGWQPWGC